MNATTPIDPRAEAFIGVDRRWWDTSERMFVKTKTLYLPQGCPDWGTVNGTRNELCVFCSLPNAVREYEEVFYEGSHVPFEDQVTHFQDALVHTMEDATKIHTLFIFNAGSFLSEKANPISVWEPIIGAVINYPSIQRVVIESRATLITKERLVPLLDKLNEGGIKLTIRVGIETKNDYLRLKVLKKGHSRKDIEKAVSVAHEFGVLVGGYVLLKPAIHDDIRTTVGNLNAGENELNQWAETESIDTIDWILGQENLAMDEAYFGATCVANGALLQKGWEAGKFVPATLSSVFRVLKYAAEKYGPRVHLLPMKDTPYFVAVSSNHVAIGLPEDLTGAEGCDLEFHSMLQNYRETMDPSVLILPACEICNPKN